MELKKFEAPTLAQALKVVKRELGSEAVILSTRTKRSGFGLLNRSSVEVTATVSDEALTRKEIAERHIPAEKRQLFEDSSAAKQKQVYDALSGRRLTRQLNNTHSQSFASELLQQNTGIQQSSLVQQDANAQQRRVITQRRYIDIRDDESPAEELGLHTHDRVPPQMNRVAQRIQPSFRSVSGPVLPRLLAELVESGIEERYVKDLGEELKAIMLRDQINKEDVLRLHLGRLLMSRVRCAKPLSERLRDPRTPRVITFIGPTGVGKTTTLAKIAAELVINQKKGVTLCTTDTYKIAAVEQLQTYANILKIPLEVCQTDDGLGQLASQIGPDEIVLVDTAGFGPKDESKLEDLQVVLGEVRSEVHLCLSTTTRDRDLISAIERFKILKPNYLVMTKLDETNVFGNIFNTCAKSSLALSYFTMGQRVPEDIEVATKERLADLILDITGGRN